MLRGLILALALLIPPRAHAEGTIVPAPSFTRWKRPGVQISNDTLPGFVQATAKGYLEVVIPKERGHVYFRHGGDVFDFAPDGFRAGGVRPIGSDRYGALVRLSASEERRLTTYLSRLKKTGGAELGAYDFEGERGFHCVSWMNRVPLGDHGETLVELLGGHARDGESMPRFAHFMLKRAARVDRLVAYQAAPTKPGKVEFHVATLASTRAQYRAGR